MKSIHIFRAGTHTAMSGAALDFTDAMLQEAANGYNTDLHEAPIVVGHPKDNGPAFGWIKGLEYREGNLYAIPHQVNPEFEEQVQAGAYKKVSASLYTPDAPANPTPGKYYVRHVGFLGAQPPSIKGLEAIGFHDAEEGTLEFSQEWEVAGVFRRLREFFIEKFGIEDADKAIPGYLVENAEDAARAPKQLDNSPAASFAEPTSGDTTMTEEELKQAQDALDAERKKLEAEQASFAEAQETAAAVALANRKKAIADRVEALVKDGKVLPAKAQAIKDFAEKLDRDAVVEFGEGEDRKSQSATEFFFGLIAEGKSPVNFSEAGAEGEGTAAGEIGNSRELADAALDYQESERQKGRTVSITQAVNHVRGQAD